MRKTMNWAAGAAMTLLLGTPALAGIGGDLLVDQRDFPDGLNYVASNFGPMQDAFDSEAADDFTVTSADGWSIDTVEISGTFTNGSGPEASVNVTIYDSSAPLGFSLPGIAVCSYTEIATSTRPGGDGGLVTFLVSLPTPCELGPGTYWLSVQANMPPSTGVFRWGSRSASNGNFAAWRNPGEGTPFNCPNWQQALNCGQSTGPDLIFAIFGFEDSFFSDGFESGDASLWSNSKGNLDVNATAALEGSFGLQVTVDGSTTKSFVQSSEPGQLGTFPIGLTAYRFNFLMNANSVDLGSNGKVEIVRLFDSELNKLLQLSLQLKANGTYKMVATAFEDSGSSRMVGQLSVGASDVTALSVEWVAASADGDNNGQLRILRNGSLQLEVTDLDTDTRSVSVLRMGLPKGSAGIPGAGGSIYFDSFESFSSLPDE